MTNRDFAPDDPALAKPRRAFPAQPFDPSAL